ncbi:MAG TPA: rubrerythrin family protein [Clostridiales bacterium]|nr:rubrerythrin family protein [Clostridiales bacterium]
MDLKGSRTEKNLLQAFAGESQVRNKYTYFASQAKKEGYEQISSIFLESAEHEKEHAKRAFKFLQGIGDTKENLKTAIEGEHYEWTTMYKEFEEIAREEGFDEIAEFFSEVAKAEKEHEKRYKALLDNLENGTVFKKSNLVRWKCRNCGYVTHAMEEAPDVCPCCVHPKAFFEVFCENY